MNSKPIFHIFGVPDGFDILNGTPDITPYFQRYYNGSEENTKFSIHRGSNGNITYAYLKYNLSSYQSRTGSFFGMSLTFSNEYCTNPMKLYELFDLVYANKVLGGNAEKGLLQKIEVESKIQARYLIPNFGSAKDYIQQEIEFVLLNNITNKFANSFQPIRVTFKNDQSHLVAQIPFADANNEKIISLLHTYNRIAISPDWEPEPTPSPKPKIEIAPETIKLYDENMKNYQSYLIEGFANVKAANINDARQEQAKIESVLKNLQSGTSTDRRLPQLITDYKVLSGQFAELIQKIADEQTPPPRKPGPPIPWWKRYRLYIFGVAVFVIFVFVLSNIFDTDDTKGNPNTPSAPQTHIALAREELQAGNYQAALNELKKEVDYTQHGLYDSIYDPWIASLLNDQEWNKAWRVAKEIEKNTLKNEKQSEIRYKCQDYFDNQVRNADKSKAKKIKEEIEGLQFDYEDEELHISELGNKLNTSQNTNTSGSSTDHPVETAQNKKQKYKIKGYIHMRDSDSANNKAKTTTWDEELEKVSIEFHLPAYVYFHIVTVDGKTCSNKEKFFDTTDKHLSAKELKCSPDWYKIEINDNNIDKTFLFQGPGNKIELKFIKQ